MIVIDGRNNLVGEITMSEVDVYVYLIEVVSVEEVSVLCE